MSDEREPRPFQTVLREAQQGSEEAAHELYETYVKHVLRCVRQRMYHKLRPRFDSQDFVQQVWASFFVGEVKLPDFQTPDELIAYLRTMAERKVVMEGRRLRGGKCNAALEELIDPTSEPIGPHPATRLPTPSAVAIFRERYQKIIGQHPPKERTIAELRLEGNTFPEISEQLGVEASAVRKAMRRLKRRSSRPPKRQGE